jgi:TRAP-type C4-dicarboxylate transport system permease small subunit
MRHWILRLDHYLTGIAFGLACLLLAIIACLGFWQVVTRFVLSQPSVWTEEVLRRLLIWCVMLGTVVAIRKGALVSVDLILRVTSGVWRTAVRLFVAIVTCSFLATIVWFGISLAYRVRFQTFSSIEISIAWAYAAIPFGAGLGIVAVVAHFLDPPSPETNIADTLVD